ncbi:transporter substrate-binding domain-containing protein [Congregibacter sp.]|uniref:transporter substrate-binding domain-containing protein n=1 Tax=Congregibacter sp. TaxID=2744308 RepID=UPI003F6D4458
MFKPVQLLASGFLALSVLLAPLALAGDTLDRVVKNKTLVVGMSGDQPPMNMRNRQGELMGFDVDLANALASAMGAELKLSPMPFGDLTKALEDGDVDMVLSGMAITAERSRSASFVGPYMMSGKSILATRTALEQIASGGIAATDVKLAALKNSTSATFVTQAAPNATLVEVANYDEAIAMVTSGEAAGMVADAPVCKLQVLRNPDAGLVTLDKPLTVEPFGIALASGDAEFLNLVQNYLRAYEGTGLLTKLRQKWLENSSWVAALP